VTVHCTDPSNRQLQHPTIAVLIRLAVLTLIALSVSAKAQESWGIGQGRPSMTGAYSAARRQPATSADNYNLALGPVSFNLSSSVNVEFNDNVNLAESGRLSDFIITPSINLGGVWRATELNTLRLDIGAGVRYYLQRSDYNQTLLSIAPGSRLAFDVYIGDTAKLTFYDSFFTDSDPTEQAGLSKTSPYVRFENSAGVDYLWDLNAIILTAGYSHFSYTSLENTYKYLNNNSDNLIASISHGLTDLTNIGIEASGARTTYSHDFQNDSTSGCFGMFMDSTMTRFLKWRIAGGWQIADFVKGGGNGDLSNLSSWYGSLTITHALSNSWLHTLTAGRECQFGLITNYEAVDFVRYAVTAGFIRALPLTFSGFFEHVADSPATVSEHLNRYGFGVGTTIGLSKNTGLRLSYDFIRNLSDLQDYSYYQNRASLTLDYKF